MKVNVEDDLEEKTSELRDEIKTMVWENAGIWENIKIKKNKINKTKFNKKFVFFYIKYVIIIMDGGR